MLQPCDGVARLALEHRDEFRRRHGLDRRPIIALLAGSRDLLAGRMTQRTDHFMPSSLLPSQLEALEPLAADEKGFSIDIDRPIAEIADLSVARLAHLAGE